MDIFIRFYMVCEKHILKTITMTQIRYPYVVKSMGRYIINSAFMYGQEVLFEK